MEKLDKILMFGNSIYQMGIRARIRGYHITISVQLAFKM